MTCIIHLYVCYIISIPVRHLVIVAKVTETCRWIIYVITFYLYVFVGTLHSTNVYKFLLIQSQLIMLSTQKNLLLLHLLSHLRRYWQLHNWNNPYLWVQTFAALLLFLSLLSSLLCLLLLRKPNVGLWKSHEQFNFTKCLLNLGLVMTFSRLLSKKIKIEICRHKFDSGLCGCETWCLTIRE